MDKNSKEKGKIGPCKSKPNYTKPPHSFITYKYQFYLNYCALKLCVVAYLRLDTCITEPICITLTLQDLGVIPTPDRMSVLLLPTFNWLINSNAVL